MPRHRHYQSFEELHVGKYVMEVATEEVTDDEDVDLEWVIWSLAQRELGNLLVSTGDSDD